MEYDPPPLNAPISWPSIDRGVRCPSPLAATRNKGQCAASMAVGSHSTVARSAARQIAWSNLTESPPSKKERNNTDAPSAVVSPLNTAVPCTNATGSRHKQGGADKRPHVASAKTPGPTRVIMEDMQTKEFNYNRVGSRARRNKQIDDLDQRLREEQEVSRRLRSTVTALEEKLKAAEAGRRRSNGLERALFSHLAETEALVVQRERLMRPGADETRAECLEAARKEAHERLALVLRNELEATGTWMVETESEPQVPIAGAPPRTQNATSATGHPMAARRHGTTLHQQQQQRDPPLISPAQATTATRDGKDEHHSPRAGMKKKQQQQVDRNFHGDRSHHPWMCGGNGSACASCWDSDVVMQAYRSAAAGTVRRLSSALFGQELLAVEAARTSAAERERMLEGRARALFESQVSLQVEKDQLESFKASLQAEVREAKAALHEARTEREHQRDMVNDAERVRSSLSRHILSMQVARDQLSEAVGERLYTIQAAVRQRVGFLPRAVERAVNDLVALCSVAGTPDRGHDKGVLLREEFSVSSRSCSSSS